MTINSDIGKKGEDLATEYLLSLGYEIKERNWRYKKAEIDIIAMDGKTLVFFEVKTRTNLSFGQPEEFISEHQQSLIFAASQSYMEQTDHDWEIRFDCISIFVKEKNEWKDYELKHLLDIYH